MGPSIEDVMASKTLPELSLKPTAAQVFMFSAVTWNRHHIHFCADAARAEGHSGVVVQRGLIGNFLARMLTQWLGGKGEIRALSWKVIKSAMPGQELRCRGEVTGSEEREGRKRLRCALSVVDAQERVLAEGSAELELG